jgi:hypothetical protein
MAVTWPIERDNAIVRGGHVDEPARLEVLNHTAVAMEKDQGLAFASFDKVESHTLQFDKSSHRWVVVLGPFSQPVIRERGER